jgi:phenylalanyl-tRNA synthetase beta chain
MKAPISWLRDFVDIDLSVADLARLVTMAGMEVEAIQIIGLPLPGPGSVDALVSGMEWKADKIVVGAISEVMPHPNADRLVLCRLFDGREEHVVLTGAPNLFEYKGRGPLPKPIKVAYAREGAEIYDGHQAGQVRTTLKRAKIRGVESYSMVCSEKELGISDEHEGILILEDQAQAGTPLAEYMGDAVLDIKLLPSYARCASMLGLAREIAAMTRKPLRTPAGGQQPPLGKADFATIEITQPELNPRFVLGLIQKIEIRPSPAWVQRRLKLAGMRPINNIVDATNYVMLEIGEPLHAFDYDVLVRRAGGEPVKITTRTAHPGEKLITLDGVERALDPASMLVCDEAGALSLAGVMGGAESEVFDASHPDPLPLEPETDPGSRPAVRFTTSCVLLEGAAWNFINIRRTASAQGLASEASYRFSRGVHPSMAERGVRRGLELMHEWGAGHVARGLVDAYPRPPQELTLEITPADVRRSLGIELDVEQIQAMLERLEFQCRRKAIHSLLVTVPDHRLDIGEGIAGRADLVEEIARVYGYEKIPEARLADELPPQVGNPVLEREERIRDLLVRQGMQEIVSYRWTTPEREARLSPQALPDDRPYLRIANPLSYEKSFLRHSVLASVLEAAERNARFRDRLALFEIGPQFLAAEGEELPDEPRRLACVLSGLRSLPDWQGTDSAPLDFYDLKGILAVMIAGLDLPAIQMDAAEHPTFHPGKCARITIQGQPLGVFGELHPQVRAHYDWPPSFRHPVLAADLNLELMIRLVPVLRQTASVPPLPPVLEDLAVVVDEPVPAERVAGLIRQTGGKLVSDVQLFDVYRGEKVGPGKKSLAYALTYQPQERTLTDQDVAAIRTRILKRLEQELGAKLRA